MKTKTAMSLLSTLILLAFGPRENRELLFRTPAEMLYGETTIFRDDHRIFSIAKNVSSGAVELGQEVPIQVWSTGTSGNSSFSASTDRRVYSQSVAVIERSLTGDAVFPNAVRVGSGHPNPPRSLHISTEAEALGRFLWPAIVLGLAVVLTYLINDYSWECGAPIAETERQVAEP